ncbi:FixH family protein [Actinomycetes bacterium KLBMP 9797]
MRRWIGALAAAIALAWWAVAGSGGAEPPRMSGAGRLYAVAVTLDRATTGAIAADVRVEEGGAPARNVESVSVSAAMPGMGHVTPEVAAHRAGAGHFVARGEFFAMAGEWQLTIRVRGPSGSEVSTVNVTIEREKP